MTKNLFCFILVTILSTASVLGQNTYKVGDLYERNQIKGIVFYVDRSRQHGKIISVGDIEDGYGRWATSHSWNWDYRNIKVGATDKYDGRKNHEIIQRIPDWRRKFPIFCACYDYGSGWFIPSKEELIEIGKQAPKINYTLSMYNYKILSGNYYSSTELDESLVWNVWISGYTADCYEVNKDSGCKVRAIHLF